VQRIATELLSMFFRRENNELEQVDYLLSTR
jgi:hypothetical protein